MSSRTGRLLLSAAAILAGLALAVLSLGLSHASGAAKIGVQAVGALGLLLLIVGLIGVRRALRRRPPGTAG